MSQLANVNWSVFKGHFINPINDALGCQLLADLKLLPLIAEHISLFGLLVCMDQPLCGYCLHFMS